MSPTTLGLLYGAATLAALFSGLPIAFALGSVATAFMLMFMPVAYSAPLRRTSMRNSPALRC